MTPWQERQRALMAQRRDEAIEHNARVNSRHAEMKGHIDDSRLLRIAEHHAPCTRVDFPATWCEGCDIGDADYMPIWPCSTWLLIEGLVS